MRQSLPKLNISYYNFMRICGYQRITNPHKNNEESFARSLHQGNFYPRFHIYIENNSLTIHLDMKKASYEGTSAHSGEYEGPLVEQELKRITNCVQKQQSENAPAQKLGFHPIDGEKKPWWKKIFS